MVNYKKRTDEMYLVYQDEENNRHYQHWADLQESGTLIDPETGDDMELVGWTIPGWISGTETLPQTIYGEEGDYAYSREVLVLTTNRTLELWYLQRQRQAIEACWVDRNDREHPLESVTRWCDVPSLPQ
jgi:hypothetical protein